MSQTDLMVQVSPETEIRSVEGVEWVYYDGERICQLGRKKALDNVWVHPEPGYKVGRCKMIKRDGMRCKNPVRHGWTVCHYHGAGPPSNPGGLTNAHITSGRYTGHLPTRLISKLEESMSDFDALSMAPEMHMLTVRIAERFEALDTNDSIAAWGNIRGAYAILNREEVKDEDWERALTMMYSALEREANDKEVWRDVGALIEQRRKLAETERRRVMDARQTMTVEQANAFISYLMNSVQEHVQDPEILRAIADDLNRVTL